MGLRIRTQTVQNGEPGKRDVRWGLDVLVALIPILALLWSIAKTGWHVAEKVTSWDDRLARAETMAIEGKAERTKLRNEFDAHVAESVEQHKHFLSKEEFYSYMAPEVRRGGAIEK